MKLRDYQQEQLDFLCADNGNAVIQSPTGTGKSVVMKYYIDWYRNQHPNEPIVLITPNQTLNYNMYKYLGDSATLAHSGYKPDLSKQILVTTFHSAKKYLPKFNPTLVIGDELHRCKAETYQDCFKYGRIRKGFTATPNRADGKSLYPLFNKLHLSPQIGWFIEQGYLSNYNLHSIDCPLFDSGVDDFDSQEKVFGTLPEIKKTVKTYIDRAVGKTLIFCTNINHGVNLKAEFRKHNINVRFLCSKPNYSDDLNESLDTFKNGDVDVLINCRMFTEGVDLPFVQTLMLCMFTYSTPLFLQIVGRLLRVLPGTPKKELIDLCGNVFYHGSPKSAFYEWNLYGFQSDKVKTNRESVFYHCYQCDEPLFKKKYIQGFAEICCQHCQTVQMVEQPRKSAVESVRLSEEVFTLSDYDSETLESIANAVRITNMHYKKASSSDKCKMISQLDIPDEIKIKAMRKCGVSDRTLEQFL